MRPFILKLLLLFVFVSCKQNKQGETNIKDNCVHFNHIGLDHYHQYSETSNPELLDTAIYYLNKSIECNPKYIAAKWNLLPILSLKKDYLRALEITEELYESTQSPFYLIYKAYYLERIGDQASAQKNYEIALKKFNYLYKNTPNSLELISEVISLKLQLGLMNTKQAVDEFEIYRKQYCKKDAHKNKMIDIHIKELKKTY